MTTVVADEGFMTVERRLGVAGRHVERVIARIAPASGPTSASAAACAQLRRGLGRPPGTVPEIWTWTVDGLPIDARSEGATPVEAGVHHALTLFAFHQQSRPEPMHDPSRPLGAGLRVLADRVRGERAVQDTPVYRRFIAMATAQSLAELVVHARGLVGQLRAESLAFDYARFADDLCALQLAGRDDGVRRRWARAFFARSAIGEDVGESLEDTASSSARTPSDDRNQP